MKAAPGAVKTRRRRLVALAWTWLRCQGGPYLDRHLDRHCKGWWADAAMRYQPVLAALRQLGPEPSVLEIGSGAFGITPYLGRPVVGVDLAFPDRGALLRPVLASATRLPFADRQFDAVVAVDVLEHVAAEERRQVVQEMLRVARRMAVLAVPCGEAAARQDVELDELYRKLHGQGYAFLQEHLAQGLPSPEDLADLVREAARRSRRAWRLRVGKNANLRIRRAFMRSWIETHGERWGPVEKVALALMPLLWRFTVGDCYRRVVVLQLEGVQPQGNGDGSFTHPD